MNNIQNIWKKTTTYYLVMITIAVFIFIDCIIRGPFKPIVSTIDGLKIKYMLMAITAFFLLMVIIIRKKKLFIGGIFKMESKFFLLAIGSLAIITLFYQMKNGFKSFAISELFYLLAPLLFVILIISVDSINITRVLDNCFYLVVIAFVLGNIDILNPASFMSISFWDSASPFENGSSIIFVCFELYFLIRYGKRNGKSFVCLILTALTLKRLSVIKGILFFIFIPFLMNKKVPKWLLGLVIVLFCVMPFVLMYIYSNDFASIMLANYGLEWNQFTMDRFKRTVFVLSHIDQMKYGFGSITYFLTNSFGQGEFANRSLHSDVLRIYLECSFVGTFIYNTCYFMAVRRNLISFLLMLHIFIEMIINHPIGAGNVGNWIIIYLMIAYFNYREEVPFYREGKVKRKQFKLGKFVI